MHTKKCPGKCGRGSIAVFQSNINHSALTVHKLKGRQRHSPLSYVFTQPCSGDIGKTSFENEKESNKRVLPLYYNRSPDLNSFRYNLLPRSYFSAIPSLFLPIIGIYYNSPDNSSLFLPDSASKSKHCPAILSTILPALAAAASFTPHRLYP